MRKFIPAALLAALIVVLGAFPAFAQGDAYLRVAHLSVDAGAVDVYVNGEAALEGVEFGAVSGWMAVAPGTYSVAVVPAGTSVDEAVIGPVDVAVEADGWYTVAALGSAARPDVAPLTVQIIEEDYSPITLGETRVTLLHAIPNANLVSLIADEDNVLVAGLAYPDPSVENDGLVTLDILAGTYDLQVTLTENPEAVVFDLPGTSLTAQRNIFIAAAGLAEDPQLVFVSTNPDEAMGMAMADEGDAGTDAHLRVAHLSEDAPAVDVYINGEVSGFTGVAYPAVSGWTKVPAGTYSVAVAPAGTSIDQAVIGPVDVTVEGGEWYTVAAVGLVSNDTLKPHILVEDYSEIPTGQARFTVLHASPGAPPVDVLVNGEAFAKALSFPGTYGDNSGAMTYTVLAGSYDIQVTGNDDPDTVLLDVAGFNLQAGSSYLIAAVNTVDDLNVFVKSVSADEIANAR